MSTLSTFSVISTQVAPRLHQGSSGKAAHTMNLYLFTFPVDNILMVNSRQRYVSAVQSFYKQSLAGGYKTDLNMSRVRP